MKFSQIWCMIVALLVVFAVAVSCPSAQTEEPSAVNDPSSAEVQPDSVEAQPSSDEPEQKKAALAPSRDTAPAADVETARLYNEFWSKFLDGRARKVDWWLEATAIFLTLIGVAAAILGYLGFKRLDRIESEARKNMEASAESAQNAQRYEETVRGYVKEAKARRDELQSITEEQKADSPDSALYKANEVEKFDVSLGQAVAAAISFEEQNKTEEAIEKWRSIANIAEETAADLAAEAWLKTGELLSSKSVDNEDWERVVETYDKAIKLNPNLTAAYNNRGNAQFSLGQYEAAVADYGEAIARNSDDHVAYNNRGNARADLGQYEAAVADYGEAIARNSDYAIAYYNQGLAKIQLKLLDEARQDLRTALNLVQKEDDINTDLLARVILILDKLDRGVFS